ncbi:hypothetical protein JL722_9863 [Aureococcus anophagefferens]|nr:hypothetical protein JL722_9863 [Aureococcus anophagefferens]
MDERGGGCVDCGGLLAECFARLNGDLYLALGVPAGEAGPRVKKSYRRLCLLYHPDKCGGKATELFHLLQRAWEVLGDDASRARYDRSKPVHVVGARRRASPKTKQPASDENRAGRPDAGREARGVAAQAAADAARAEAPCKLMVLETACDSATIRWAAGGGESAVSHYHVQFRELFVGRPPEPWPATHQKVKTTACRKKNLAPSTAYEVRVRGVAALAARPGATLCLRTAPAPRRRRRPTRARSYCNEKLASLKGAWESCVDEQRRRDRAASASRPVYPPGGPRPGAGARRGERRPQLLRHGDGDVVPRARRPAPRWYCMTNDDAVAYYWHSLTGDTAWDHPGEDVWRECAAPDLPGRKVYSWAGPAAASG